MMLEHQNSEGRSRSVTTTSVAVYACTYRRNDELGRLMRSLAASAATVAPEVAVAVVVVDDNVDGRARDVVDQFDESAFSLGLHYVHSGSGNISTARNMGIEAASGLADWVAMTDDDCVVVPEWLAELLRVQAGSDADAVTGPMKLRFPEDSPAWLTTEPFADLGSFGELEDGQTVDVCATNNSMIRSAFLKQNPDIRFDRALGQLGGEDMVFYRRAVARGLTAAYSAHGVVHGEESDERATLRYQLRQGFWLGNTEAVTNLHTGSAGRVRLTLRGLRRLATTTTRPARRARSGESVQVRYTAALLLQSLGLIAGAMGLRFRHR